MTPAQTTLHWRLWGQCADANHWFMIGARLSPDARRSADESIYQKLVWRTAGELALQAHRAVTADDLRHACYVVATTSIPGAPKAARPVASMKELDNRAFSRVLNLWRLLIDPDNIEAQMNWDHPENDDRRRYIAVLKRCARGSAYVGNIAANIYGTRLWEDLDLAALRNLCRILGERQKEWDKGVASPSPGGEGRGEGEPQMAGIEKPF